MDLQDKIRLNRLFDIYGELLTDKQRMYFEYYYLNDYSLSEISDLLSVSRNAVHMQLKNVVHHLENYEEKLNVLKNKIKIKKLIKCLEENTLDNEKFVKELEKVL